MGYRSTVECIADLERHGRLVRIDVEVDPFLEMAAVQRRVYAAEGPALLFTRPKGCRFPMVGNLFGTLERTRFIFRDTLADIELLVRAKKDPRSLFREPLASLRLPAAALHLLPRKVTDGPLLEGRGTLPDLPRLHSWPLDGGPFITLPQVYTELPGAPGFRSSNLGMYRVQLAGNSYGADEAGIHYQIHRGIGAHHAEALRRGEPLRVNVFVGGPPAMSVAAVMPLPEGMPEVAFAGLLAGHRIPFVTLPGGLPAPAEADFCLCGTIDPGRTLPEGPFGDHLGYYSLVHDFPVMRVERVYHRRDAVWPFTVVGRPPQEDTSFGAFIHELTGDLIPEVLPGVEGVHAVDAAGVHPLLLAVAAERYVPYAAEREPMELLTIASAILGQGQLSLAKYLFIAAREDGPPDLHHVGDFLRHVLERVDWRRDIHFTTATTVDTLDYSGTALNRGSKAVIAAAGPKRRELGAHIGPLPLPDGFSDPRVCLPGIVAVRGPRCTRERWAQAPEMELLAERLATAGLGEGFPLLVVVDDSDFTAHSLDNFLWTVFTRSDPACDTYGVRSFTRCKHWGCDGPMLIDARRKPHHAPPLEEDPAVEKRVDDLGAPGGPLHGII